MQKKVNVEEKKYGKSCWLSDEEVADEIDMLNSTEEVALARREDRLKYKQRQKLYALRNLYKRGKALMEAGITREMLDAAYEEEE
jgi:hypothetical protein